jgi:endonuclease YncB( thermonuclease family)
MGGLTTWLRRRSDRLVRAAAFALAGTAIGAAVVAGDVLRRSSPPAAAAAPEAAADAKDQNRVAARHQAPPSAPEPSAKTGAPSGDARSAATAPGMPGGWRDDEFTFVEVVDGRSFRAGAVTVRLAGIDLPHPEQVCRTLDNRLEQCAARAATQLELLTRSRAVACRYRLTTTSEAVGACRVGSSDLAARMIRTGYVQRSAEPEETAATTAPRG